MRMQAALIASLVLSTASRAQEPPSGKPCDTLRREYRLKNVVEGARVNSLCWPKPPFGPDACDPKAVWAALRAQYVRYLSAAPGDEVGRSAAEFLATSSVTLATIDMSLVSDDARLAYYKDGDNTIYLSIKPFETLRSTMKGSRLPAESEAVVADTAVSLVHELRHAREAQELGHDFPRFFESESLAYADEALFVWARLAQDPDHHAMGTFNRVLLSTAGYPSPPPQWWKQALEVSDVARLRASKEAAKAILGSSLRVNTANNWFSARTLGRGLRHMDDLVQEMTAMKEWSAFNRSPDFYEMAAASARRTIKKLSACRDREASAVDRANFQKVITEREGDLLFYEDPVRQERLMRYYREEREKQAKRRADLL